MVEEAIFSDGTRQFVNPVCPRRKDRVTITLRTHKDDRLSLWVCSHKTQLPMVFSETKGLFSFYKASLQLDSDELSYYFLIKDGTYTYYYDRFGLSNGPREEFFFKIYPDFDIPDWTRGAIIYQILVDRFNRGNVKTDVLSGEYFYINSPVNRIENWDEPVAPFDVCNFYGGDLPGVQEKLQYLKSLGVEAIYFNPIFVSPSNHKYDAQDYDYIDPHLTMFYHDEGELLPDGEEKNSKAYRYIDRVTNLDNLEGSNRFFASFVEEAHKRGIKIILDGVFNHCGSFHKWLDREGIYRGKSGFKPGAYWEKESPYNTFFSFSEDKWPENATYDGWWGHDTLPKLNYEGSEKLCEEILRIAAKWVSPPYNCDGWRLDVAADLGHTPEFNHKFWARFREAVKKANPEAVILAEHYGDPSSWLNGKEWDTIMNYDAFMEPVSYFLTGMEKHSEGFDEGAIGDAKRFENTMLWHMSKMPFGSLYSSMNQLSNHDHSRFLTRTNHKVGRVSDLGSEAASEGVNKAVFRQGMLMQTTWPGAPTLYYGDEAGLCGFTDPDNRRTFPWENMDENLTGYVRDCIFIHKNSKALREGSLIFLRTDKNLLSYGRFFENEKIVVVINTDRQEKEVSVPVWKLGVEDYTVMQRIIISNENTYSIMPDYREIERGALKFIADPISAYIFRAS